MNSTELPAVTGPVERGVRAPLRMVAGSDGYYLHAIGADDKVLHEQPEPKWFEKLENAEASAIAIGERTGIAVMVVRVVGRVVPWHHRLERRVRRVVDEQGELSMLKEDEQERRIFDSTTAELYGGEPLAAIQMALTMWARQAPQNGSYAQMLTIFANEVEKVRAKLAPNVGISRHCPVRSNDER